jgi:hypothetical protein
MLDKSTNKPAAGKIAYLSIPGPVFEFRSEISDSAGKVVFLVKHLETSKQLIFQTNNITDNNILIQPAEPFAQKYPAANYAKRVNEPGDTLPFFGKADVNYVLDDYVRFPTMEEVLREFVFEVKVKKVRSKFRFEVFNKPYNVFFDGEPLVLLDGIPVFDMDALIALDPLKIRSIAVVSRKYYFGSMVFSGIVSFSSYDGDLAGYQLPREALVREYKK